MSPTELKMQPTVHFRISEKSRLLKLKLQLNPESVGMNENFKFTMKGSFL
jgi:hypothetical protein